jgi:hypothetical protein
MKINSIHSHHLTQALHLQFTGGTRDLIEKFNPAALKIGPQFETFRASVEKEDLCYKIIHKSDISESKKEADQARDNIILGINNGVKSALHHFDVTVSEAAKRLKIVLDTYNTPTLLTRLPYDAETAAVTSLLQEFEGKYRADVQATGLTTLVDELRRRNDKFGRLTQTYNEQQAAKPSFRFTDIRRETDEAYKKIVFIINALIIMEGETAYAPFVTELNALIKHYNNLLAQHLGRNKAKRENSNLISEQGADVKQ